MSQIAQSDATTVEIARVRIPEGRLPEEPENTAQIAASMAVVGLLEPIVVREAEDGGVDLVAGLHRLRAAASLGWPEIPATWFVGDAARAEMAEISENLHRRELDYYTRASQLARYRKLYDLIHQRDSMAPGAIHEDECVPATATAVAEAVGEAPRTVRDAIRVAEAFGDDGLDALREAEVPARVAREAARLPEAGRREFVDRVARGEDPRAALAAGGPTEEEAFLADLPLRPMLKGRALRLFEADALLYLRTREARLAMHRAVKPLLDEVEPADRGRFGAYLAAFVRARHPREWVLCFTCNGAAMGCPRCGERGYSLG